MKNNATDNEIDPYTISDGGTKEPPKTWFGRLRSLGPGVVVSGSIVGSGEILLTAGLGAAVGFSMFGGFYSPLGSSPLFKQNSHVTSSPAEIPI